MSKFETVAAHFRDQIGSGELQAGDKLPSTREIMGEFDVSYGTVRGAMLVLKTQGLLEGRQGEGVYVADDAASIVRRRNRRTA